MVVVVGGCPVLRLYLVVLLFFVRVVAFGDNKGASECESVMSQAWRRGHPRLPACVKKESVCHSFRLVSRTVFGCVCNVCMSVCQHRVQLSNKDRCVSQVTIRPDLLWLSFDLPGSHL